MSSSMNPTLNLMGRLMIRGAIALSILPLALASSSAAWADEEPEAEVVFPERGPGLCQLGDNGSGRWVTTGDGRLIPLDEVCAGGELDFFEEYVVPDERESGAARAAAADETRDRTIHDSANRDSTTHDGTNGVTYVVVDGVILYPDQTFWQTFLTAASPEAIVFAQSVEQEAVLEYGQTICPSLDEGKTMDEVRATQIENGLPADFDAAVNVAAIHAYCPQHETQIGR